MVFLAAVVGTRPAGGQTIPYDSRLHFGISAGLAVVGYAGAATVTSRESVRALLGGGFALSLGVAKELYDLTGAGDSEWRDLAWDMVGTASGVIVSVLVDSLIRWALHARARPAR